MIFCRTAKPLIFIALFASSPVWALFGGAPKDVSIELQTSKYANLNNAKQSAPLPVSVFVLKSGTAFNKADYFALEDNAKRKLGDDLLSKSQYIMLPNSQKRLAITPPSSARYLGFIGGYSTLKDKKWRKVVPVSELENNKLIVRFNKYGLNTHLQAVKPKSLDSLYVEGGIGYGILNATGNTYQYNFQNTIQMMVQKTQQLPQFSVAAGYEWVANQNWVSKLHLDKVSAGIEASYNPNIEINGQLKSFVAQSRPDLITHNFKSKTSALQFMLDGKVNFLSFGNFSPFVNLGLGMVQYQTKYTRTLLVGDNLTSTKIDATNHNMVYQLGLGLDYKFTENLSMSAGINYQSPSKIKITEVPAPNAPAEYEVISNPEITLNNLNFVVKVRYRLRTLF